MTSSTSFARFASSLLVAAAALVGVVALRDQPAEACGGWEPLIEDLTTFDPAVAADPAPPGLHFDPFFAGFGGPCDQCGADAMRADWNGWLKGAIPAGDVDKLLFQASVDDLQRVAARIDWRARRGGGKPAPLPHGIDLGRWKLPAAKAKIQSALAYLQLARASEQAASFDSGLPPAELTRLVDAARAGMKASREPFLTQRYAFQVVRLSFYRRDVATTVDFFDKNSARLAKPSADLAWRARYYVAGALVRSGDRARGNLELARVHAGSPALAPTAARDFQPMEEADWRASLRLARGKKEQAQLWRLVGITQDGLVAAQEIARIDPTSNLIPLLLVRELGKAESTGRGWGGQPDAAQVAARARAYAALEQLAGKLAATRGADRPWLMRLIVGHLAAQRGDVALARKELAAAVAARPGDVRVASQARASLALALVHEGRLDAARIDEIARTMGALDAGFSRRHTVRDEVRRQLAAAYVKAGDLVEAEFLAPGAATSPTAGAAGAWEDVAFLRKMIARAGRSATAYDRFVLDGAHARADLERELALRQLLTGDLDASARTFATTGASSSRLGTDPFITHIVDCHDCDHARHGGAPWTHATFAARMAALARQAGGKGDDAARAALAVGNGYYNVTWYGNARVVLADTHQATRDTRTAERWYKRAHDLATSRELKAQAAFYAAKAELHRMITAATSDPYEEVSPLPVPATWFPVVKSYADTRYYQEILAECGHFRRWTTPRRGFRR